MELDTSTLNQIIKNHIDETIDHYVSHHAVNGSTLDGTLANIDSMIDETKRAIQAGHHLLFMFDEIRRIAQDLEIKIDMDTQGKELAFHLCRAHIVGMEQAQRVIAGEALPHGESPPAPEVSAVPELQTDSQPASEKPLAFEPDEPGMTLDELINRYREHQLNNEAWRPNSARNAEPQLNALLSYFKPETDIRTIAVGMVQSYLNILWALPKRYTLLKQYKGVALWELDPEQLMKDHTKHLDQTTVRGYMLMAQALFKYAEDLDLIDKSPVRSTLIPSKKKEHAREQRDAYTIEQLHEVFNPDTFMKWVNYRGFSPAKFWIPVLCLCSTGRLEEICGLRAVDVVNTPEGLTLSITFHDDRKIKNQNSVRVAPVVKVISDRLMEYADSLPEGSLLFPELTVANHKLSHNFGKAWQRYVRNKVGIKGTKIAPMHSLRHFLIDKLYKAMVPERVIKQLDGHAPGGGETGSRYAKGLEVETLREHCLPVITEVLTSVLKPLIDRL